MVHFFFHNKTNWEYISALLIQWKLQLYELKEGLYEIIHFLELTIFFHHEFWHKNKFK